MTPKHVGSNLVDVSGSYDHASKFQWCGKNTVISISELTAPAPWKINGFLHT